LAERIVNIQLFGQAYTFKASGQASQIQEVADYLTGQVEKAQAAAEGPSKLDTLILAALNIANDFFEMRQSRQELLDNIDQRCKVLIEDIEASV
jgi:cell division protein ZapA